MSSDVQIMLLAALVAGAAALGPRVIALLPEPELPERPAPEEEPPQSRFRIAPVYDKVAYADLAARPLLALLLALGAGVVAAVLGHRLGAGPDLVVVLPLIPLGVWLAYIDARTTYLPTRLIAPAYGIAVAAVLLVAATEDRWDDALGALLGWAVYGGAFLLMWVITPGFGYGDVRLAGVLGIALGWLGWAELLLGFLGGLVIGSLTGAVLVLLRVVHPNRNPFGPYMLLAAGIAAGWGPAIADALGY